MRPDLAPPVPSGTNLVADLDAAEAHEMQLRRRSERLELDDVSEDEYCAALAAAAAAVDAARLAIEVAELERRLMEPLSAAYWRGLTIEEIDLAWGLRTDDLCALARRDPAAVRLPAAPEVVRDRIDLMTARAILSVLARASDGGIWAALGECARGDLGADQALIVRDDPAIAALPGGRLVAVHGMAPPWGMTVTLGPNDWAPTPDGLRWRGPGVGAALDRLRAAEPGPLLLQRDDLGAIGLHPTKGYVRFLWWAGSRRIELPVWGKALEQRLLDLMAVHTAGFADEIPEAALWLPAVASLTNDRTRIRLSDTAGLRRGAGAAPAMLWSRTQRGDSSDQSVPLDGPGIQVVDSVQGVGAKRIERTSVLVVQLPGTVRFGSGAVFELRADPPVRPLDPSGAPLAGDLRGGGETDERAGRGLQLGGPGPREVMRRRGGRVLPDRVVEG